MNNNPVIEFIEYCNTAPLVDVIDELEGAGLALIISSGHIIGIALNDYSVEA